MLDMKYINNTCQIFKSMIHIQLIINYFIFTHLLDILLDMKYTNNTCHIFKSMIHIQLIINYFIFTHLLDILLVTISFIYTYENVYKLIYLLIVYLKINEK